MESPFVNGGWGPGGRKLWRGLAFDLAIVAAAAALLWRLFG